MRTEFFLVKSGLEIAHSSYCSAVQRSTVPNNKKNQHMIPFPSVILTRNLSRARQPLSRVNVTGLLRRLQVKIENIYLFKTIIKKKNMETSLLKNWLCLNFLLLTKKIWVAQLFWGGGCIPTRPPARTSMCSLDHQGTYCLVQKGKIFVQTSQK